MKSRQLLKEQILPREELINLFKKEKIQDTKYGWVMNGYIIEIIALHNVEPKYLQDITKADTYKLVKKTPLSYYKA